MNKEWERRLQIIGKARTLLSLAVKQDEQKEA